MAEDGGRVPMSPGLQATLLRAREYAAGQSEAQVLLEHLLLALSEDADAAQVLEACQVDLGRLRNDVAGYLGTLNDRVPPGTPGAPAISQALTQVLKYATLAAQQGRRTSIDGAIVLAALVGDGRSMAASFLKAQGLTFDAAIQALRQAAARGAAPSPGPGSGHMHPEAQPAAANHPDAAIGTTNRAEDILARARARVETRSQRGESYQPHTGAATAPASPPPAAPPDVPGGWPAPPPAHEAAPQSAPAGGQAASEAIDEQSAEPLDRFTPPEGLSQQASLPDVGDTEVTAGYQAPAGPPTPARESPPAGEASPAAEAEAPQPPGATEAGEPALPANPPPPLERAPGHAGPAGVEHSAPPLSAPDRRPAPPHVPPTEPQPAPSGWAPPPMRPPAPPHPGARPLPPPPQGWSAPPVPTSQPPRPPGPFPARAGEAETAPAHWSRPPMPSGPRREPPSTGYAPTALVPTQAGHGYARTGGRRPAIDPSQITHSIPRRLKRGRPHAIEVWIERPPIAASGGSRSYALRPENVVARAIAVRLRPLSGKFIIDAASPETQWDQSGAAGTDRLASEAAVWRFTVTPLQSGRGVLQLAISARTLGADGVLAETQLPDQAHELRIAAGYGGLMQRIALAFGAALAGMVVIKLIEGQIGFDFYYFFKQLLRYRP